MENAKIILEEKYLIGSGLGSWAKSFERGDGEVRLSSD